MAPLTSNPVHTTNTFEDLSGVSTEAFDNPYDAILEACHGDPKEIQARYQAHRSTRNGQQKVKLLDAQFPGVSIDPVLQKLCVPSIEPGYTDPRHCLVFWARPTVKVKSLIYQVQQKLLSVAPNLWLMPQDCLHMTALEMTHSRANEEIEKLVEAMRPSLQAITDYTFDHRARLIKPMIGFDASALALSFVPAAGEGPVDPQITGKDEYTYHHLRRDLFKLCSATGVPVDSRYVVPSSHLTIGRFINTSDTSDDVGSPDPSKMKTLVEKIEEINQWLEAEYWPKSGGMEIKDGGEWTVGEEKGLNCRMGTLWYGGGESICSVFDKMFNRDRIPNPFGARPDGAPRTPARNDGYGRPPQQPQQGGYDARMSGHDAPAQGYDAPPPQRVPMGRASPATGGGGPARQLRPIKSPGGNSYAFGNLAAVSPSDFPPSQDGEDIYILLNGRYVLSAKPTTGCRPGEIGLTNEQRTWAAITLGPQDFVSVEPYVAFSDGGTSYLGALEVEAGYASARKTTDVPYDQDELAAQFIKNFQNQILAPGQILLMDVKSIYLRLTIRTTQLVNLAREKDDGLPPETQTDPRARGILTKHTKIDFFKDAKSDLKLKASNRRPATNSIVQPGFKFEDMGIGGLDTEFSAIFRRAFASRIFPPGLVEKLGIQHVRGILLYGPPGTGKTLIARQIGKMLNAREPKVINGPEVLNKYVGQSEENIRKLFADAEKEYKEKGDESGLHIIIFDELDAVCKQRGSSGGGTGVGDSVVNQLLSKLDGVDQLNNILLIGMTNRMDMIDEALLRAGRLEVHMEISLPDESGRAQILKIHTTKMRNNNVMAPDVNLEELARMTKNFSGAEISGLVKAASSFAFSRHIKVGTMAAINEDVVNMKVSREDFLHALDEVKPLFGAAEEELSRRILGDIVHYSRHIEDILEEGRLFINQVRKDESSPVLSVALHGPPGSGKTALAASMSMDSGFPFIKLLSPEDMVGYSEMQKVQQIEKTFRDAYKSPLSVIVIDDIEILLDWVPIGPRFSNSVLQALKTLLKKQPPKDRRLLIFATTSQRSVLHQLQLVFNAQIVVPNVNTQEELAHVLRHSGVFSDRDQQQAVTEIQEMTGSTEIGVGIKQILEGIRTAKQDKDVAGRFARIMSQAIADRTAFA
ncbi:AAA-domain-containing protein [Mytilinidion resinicola]|uniref:Vesicular-fusion protein SEC18 n=1 Tax=Mytilinidion resinicola TaxID=574789 RepID=A0A6A6YGU6_9PEZI|nr:AAA-domain-containing protein [Mytilinidion resinicola]KAF2808032.1 AAA-domain-containing protein [Mytilinidion resinicola]